MSFGSANRFLNPQKAVIFFIFILFAKNVKAQTDLSDSGSNVKRFVEKKIQPDSTYYKKVRFFIVPLFSPREYRVFEHDPLDLFTKTGVRVSLNMRYMPQTLRDQKYMQTHLLSVNYGLLRTSLNFGYVGRFGHLVGPFDLLLKARYDVRAIQNYFGTGNESIKEHSKRNYYRTITTRAFGGPGLSTTIGRHQTVDLSVFYQDVKLQSSHGDFISEGHGIDTSLFKNKQFGGAEAAYHFNKTNNSVFPTAGIDFVLAADYIQNLEQTSRFTNIVSALSVYIPLGKSFSLGSRVGGATIAGDADFYHLNKLGGYVNLRGYDRERFSGKTIFYNNNELRWVTDTRNYFFNGQIGFLAFFDDGRVWQPLEKSNTLHAGYGAGVILIPFNKAALTGTYCRSIEGSFIQLKAGMFF